MINRLQFGNTGPILCVGLKPLLFALYLPLSKLVWWLVTAKKWTLLWYIGSYTRVKFQINDYRNNMHNCNLLSCTC